MGRQVPDISPEGIAQLTASYRESVDREAVRSFFEDKTVDESVLVRWRESGGISAAGAARLLGMSREGYSKVENGHYPIGEHFTLAMRKLLTQLDETGFPFHPSDRSKSAPKFLTREEDYIPRKKIVSPLTHKKCANPNCNNWFYGARTDRLYCGRTCRNYMANHKDLDGIVTRVFKKPHEYTPLEVRCPNCQHEFIAKGHITSGSNRYSLRNGQNKTDGQAHHDGQKQELPG